MNYNRLVAGIFAGTGALMLIYMSHITEGAILLSTMMGFFVGEKNGERKAGRLLIDSNNGIQT